MCQNLDLFESANTDKLSIDSVEMRDKLISHYAEDEKAAFYLGNSAGKDSSALYAYIKKLIPNANIFVVHASLGAVEHPGVIELIESNIQHPLFIVKDKRKDFIGMVLLRGMFPSAKYRECTSSLKTQPINSFIRKHADENGFTTVFNVTGLRAQESSKRAAKNPLWTHKDLTTKKRQGYDWMPIFHMSEEEVFNLIKEDGQTIHPAYGDRPNGGDCGNDRLSCRFCIMASKNDLYRAAVSYTDHYHEMVALEKVVNHTMFGKTKTIHTDRLHAKGDLLQGHKVTTCEENKSKRAVMKYRCKVFIPVPLNDWVGVPVNELLVKMYEKKHRQLRSELIRNRDIEAKERANSKIERKVAKQNPDNIDFINDKVA